MKRFTECALCCLLFLAADEAAPTTLYGAGISSVVPGLILASLALTAHFLFFGNRSIDKQSKGDLVQKLLLVVGTAVVGSLLTKPYNVICLALLPSLLLNLVPKLSRRSVGTQAGLAFITCLIFAFYQRWTSMIDVTNILGPIVTTISKVLNMGFAYSSGDMTLSNGTNPVTTKVWLSDIVPFSALGFLLLPFLDRIKFSAMRAGMAFVLGAFWLTLCWMFCQIYSLATNDVLTRSTSLWHILCGLGIAGIFGFLQESSKLDSAEPEVAVSSRRPNLIVAGAIVAVVLGCYWMPYGPKKQGRVLIQEFHSDWEPAEKRFGIDEFGVRTTYNYGDMAAELASFYDVKFGHALLTDDALNSVDVLILKCPTAPYSNDELDVIERFVKKGGGIWMIGDHTNVFGMNLYLNQIGEMFGMKLNGDAILDPINTRQMEQSGLLSHPVMLGMKEPYLFYTTCSTTADVWSDLNLAGHSLLVDEPDFSQNTFFGNFAPDLKEYFGTIPQVFTKNYGQGRVSIWPDSTAFSSFCTFMPGQFETVLANVDWLNYRAVPFYNGNLLIVLGFVVVLALRKRLSEVLSSPILVGLVAVLLGGLSLLRNSTSNGIHNSVDKKSSLFVVSDAIVDHLPIYRASDERDFETYVTATVTTQRVGCRPIVVQHRRNLDETSKIMSLGDCKGLLDLWSVAELKDWISKGGTLMLLDSDSSGGFLRRALTGKEVGFSTKGGVISTREGLITGKDVYSALISPDKVLLKSGEDCCGSEDTIGQGKLVTLTTKLLFRDKSLGEQHSTPTLSSLGLYRILWNEFRTTKSSVDPNVRLVD